MIFKLFGLLAITTVTSAQVMTEAPVTHQVYFDVDIGGQPAGRIIMGLFGDVVPKTVENFRALCTGENGTSSSGAVLHYKNSPFHRVISNFMAQGGDITQGNGRGGESIFGRKFDDENFDLRFTKPYQLAMANSGKNTNGSQFFITFIKTEWLNGHHVIFGEVIGGFDIVQRLENIATSDGVPAYEAHISDSGELVMDDSLSKSAHIFIPHS